MRSIEVFQVAFVRIRLPFRVRLRGGMTAEQQPSASATATLYRIPQLLGQLLNTSELLVQIAGDETVIEPFDLRGYSLRKLGQFIRVFFEISRIGRIARINRAALFWWVSPPFSFVAVPYWPTILRRCDCAEQAKNQHQA